MTIRGLMNIGFALSLMSVLLLSGCGGCGLWGHDAIWQSWDHFKFSTAGYETPTGQDVRKSNAEHWWGCEVPIGYGLPAPKLKVGSDKVKRWDRPAAFGPVPTALKAVGERFCGQDMKPVGFHPKAQDEDGDVFPEGGWLCVPKDK